MSYDIWGRPACRPVPARLPGPHHLLVRYCRLPPRDAKTAAKFESVRADQPAPAEVHAIRLTWDTPEILLPKPRKLSHNGTLTLV